MTTTQDHGFRLKRIDQDLFDAVASVAQQRPRLRMNHNLHQESELVQRFLNVLQPGTYVRPHRHVREEAGTGFECFLVMQGAIGLLLFDAEGRLPVPPEVVADQVLRGLRAPNMTSLEFSVRDKSTAPN